MLKYIKTLLLFIPFYILSAQAVRGMSVSDSIQTDSSTILPSILQTDTLSNDSIVSKDSLSTAKKKSALDAEVHFTASDSTIFTADGIAYMFKNSIVKYKQMTLNSDIIRLNTDSSTVDAYNRSDSAGLAASEYPKFTDKGSEYQAERMRYNFKTSKGIISNVVTQQGEGFVTGERTKKMENNDMCMTDGKYTTCDNHEHPHFYFKLTKAKVRPKKWIVTGPAYLVFADVPLPLVLPFGFFPFSSTYSSGIIVPKYADEMNRGFGLYDGGYYFAINEYIDLALTGEIYTKGSWGLNAISRYNKKYKYSGSFNLSRIVSIYGEKSMPDYSESTDFKIAWTHRQDPKANPYRTLSASVNFSTSSYDRNNLNSYYNPNNFTQNTKSSSISLTQRFANNPLSLSLSANVNQRSKDGAISVTLPDFSISASSIYPLKRKNPVGKERWYEKIRLSYTGYMRNSIDTQEDLILKSSLIKDWRNGIQHNLPISATFSLFKYINITPSFNYTSRWYSSKIEKSWDDMAKREVTDTIWGFNRVFNYSGAISASTKLYGFYKPLNFFGGKKVEAIRHMFTPTVSFSATPDFGAHRFGYWDTYSYVNANTGEETIVEYSRYANGMFGTPGRGKSGSINFSFANNLEMKLRPTLKDTTNIGKKISLIDNFTVGFSYNLAADSLNWSDINTSLRLKLAKNFSLNLSGLFETYTYELNENGNPVKVNVTEWEKNGIPGRLVSTGTSFSYSINNATFAKKKKQENTPKETNPLLEGEEEENEMLDENGNALTEEEITAKKQELENEKKKKNLEKDPEGYQKFSMPWNIGFNYSMRYGKADFNKDKMRYNMQITHSLGLSGSITLTPKWKLNASGNYDFDTHKLAYMSCSISRDLHCWQMSASFVPVGPYKSYNFTISINSSMLQDVKYEQRSNYRDNITWY